MGNGKKYKKKEQHRIEKQLNQTMRNGFEVIQDEQNIWNDKFGWILKDGKPTVNSAAYWKYVRRNPS